MQRYLVSGVLALAMAAPAVAVQTAPVPTAPSQTLPAQTVPAPALPGQAQAGQPVADPTDPSAPAGQSATTEAPAAAPELTEAEQKTLKRCQAMGPGQAAQSSKCSKVMVKAGQVDPAAARAPAATQ